MKPFNEIPHDALDLRHNSGGFLPDIGLYRRGEAFRHGPHHSHYWLLGILVTCAVVAALLPWQTSAMVGKVKYWVAGMFLFAGACDIVGLLMLRKLGQQVCVDPRNKTLSITRDDFEQQLSWHQIIELQICRQRVPGNSEMNGYQLNVVWRDGDGTIRRHCLLKHMTRGFVARLGRRYHSLFGFTLNDYTRKIRPQDEANRDRRGTQQREISHQPHQP